jgi:hypothetical protein
MPNLESNGITDVSTSSSTIEEIADIMFSFQASRDDDFIAVELWRKALDSITASITLLAKNARAEFIDLLLKSYDSRSSKASVEFLTFFGSLICVAKDDIVYGSSNSVSIRSKQYLQFGVAGKPKMVCLLKVRKHNL